MYIMEKAWEMILRGHRVGIDIHFIRFLALEICVQEFQNVFAPGHWCC